MRSPGTTMRDAERLVRAKSLAIDMRMVRSSGIGRYLREVVPRVLAGMDGVDVDLLGNTADIGALDLPPTASVTLRDFNAPIYSLREQTSKRRGARAGIDVFWSPHYNVPVASSARQVVTVHDILHIARPEFVRGAHRRFYARAMFDRIRRKGHTIICDSRFTADELVRLVGVQRSSVEVIHLGVDSSWFSAPLGGSPHPRPYFVYVGNVKPHKNLAGLCDAFERVTTRLPHDLVIIGRKDGLIGGDHRLEEYTRRLGDRVTLTGEIEESRLRAYVAHAEALVLPSFYEGFGLPALEAMAAGCPAIVSSAASLPEVCGDAALYFDPADAGELADAIFRVATDSALRTQLVSGGRAHASRFTWDECARNTRGVIERELAAA